MGREADTERAPRRPKSRGDHETSKEHLNVDTYRCVQGCSIRLALDQTSRLVTGAATWRAYGIPDLGIEPLMLSDGPDGLRAHGRSGDHVGLMHSAESTCFPVNLRAAKSATRSLPAPTEVARPSITKGTLQVS